MKLARAVKRNWARLSPKDRQAWADAIREGRARRQAKKEKVIA